MNHEDSGGSSPADPPDEAGQGNSGPSLSDQDKQRIREEEYRSREEIQYRSEVRGQMYGSSAWERAKAVLGLKPGVFNEIASDEASGTRQALFVFAIATAVGYLFATAVGYLFATAVGNLSWTVLIPVVIVGAFIIAFIIRLGAAALYQLVARLFAKQVPPFRQWFRAILFASTPSAIAIIPLVGKVASVVYITVLEIVAIRDLAQVSTGTAAIVWFIAIMLGTAVTVVLFAAFKVISGLGLFPW